jgi:cytochrome P450
MIARPLAFLRWCWQRYGDVFTLNLSRFGKVVYIADPHEIERIFTSEPELYQAGSPSASNIVASGEAKSCTRRSLLLLDGETHLRDRRAMLPPFQGRRVLTYEPVVEEVVVEELKHWKCGQTIELRRCMQTLTMAVMLRVIFGSEPGPRVERLRELLPRLLDLNPLLVWLPLLRHDLGRWTPEHRYRALQHEIDELIRAEVVERRARNRPTDDVLGEYMQASDGGAPLFDDSGLSDELQTVLLAGHETTAGSLAWALARLLHHPQVLTRLRGELAAGEETYLDAVIRETLRTRPVLVGASRRITKPVDVRGWALPANTVIRVAIALAQLHRSYGDSVHDFRPERFLAGRPSPYTWIPFGGGVRRCLGASFALMEMRVALRTILGQVDLRAVADDEEAGHLRSMLFVPTRAHGQIDRINDRVAWVQPRSLVGAL